MPDLTIITAQECVNQTCSDAKYVSQGGCWPFKKNHTCKHVCQWHELYSNKVQTEEQKKNQICPKCGGPTQYVRVGV